MKLINQIKSIKKPNLFFRATHEEYLFCYKNGKLIQEGRDLVFEFSEHEANKLIITKVPLAAQELILSCVGLSEDNQRTDVTVAVYYHLINPSKVNEDFDFTIFPRVASKEQFGPQILTNRMESNLNTHVRNILKTQLVDSWLDNTNYCEEVLNGQKKEITDDLKYYIEIDSIKLKGLTVPPSILSNYEAKKREAAAEHEGRLVIARQKALEKEHTELLALKAETRRQEMAIMADALKQFAEAAKDIPFDKLALFLGASGETLGMGEAFKKLADNAQKIGNLNIGQGLLESFCAVPEATQTRSTIHRQYNGDNEEVIIEEI